jgi:putative selenoprotein
MGGGLAVRAWLRCLWLRFAWLGVLWLRLREWSGDAAYDTYIARARAGEVLDRTAFYLDRLRRRYERPSRCC